MFLSKGWINLIFQKILLMMSSVDSCPWLSFGVVSWQCFQRIMQGVFEVASGIVEEPTNPGKNWQRIEEKQDSLSDWFHGNLISLSFSLNSYSSYYSDTTGCGDAHL